MKIRIEFEITGESADAEDSTGLTESAFEEVNECLVGIGADDIEIQRVIA